MVYIAICDDDRHLLEDLAKRVDTLVKQHKVTANISIYTQSRMLEYDIEEGKYFDLILSDIEMPHIDGMKLVEDIKTFLPDVFIIFITSHIKYAVDAYELSIFRYIPKKSLDEKLAHAVQDAVKLILGRSEREYYIDMPSRAEKIMYRDIMYIQREGKNSVFFLTNGRKVRVRKSLSNVEVELDSEDFVYVDRGTVVNIQYIMKIKGQEVTVKNGEVLFASRKKIEEVRKRITEFWGKRI